MADSVFWRRTPPALFPATLGMLGLALAWMRAEAFGAPAWIGAALLAAAGGFTAFAMAAYVAKILHRPSALIVDLSPIPGRAAVSAGSMCLMVAAAGLLRATGAAEAARVIWVAGLILHAVYLAAAFVAIARAPAEARRASPTLFLPVVGFIVAPMAGGPLGYSGAMGWVLIYSAVTAVVIYALAAPAYLRGPVPVPARAAAAIFVAPCAVGGVSAAAAGVDWAVAPLLWASLAIAAPLIMRLRWLTEGGFTPLWGAFTFPVSALAGLTLIVAEGRGGAWVWAGWAALIAATAIIPPIWLLTLRAWAKGRLAPATGAATV